MSLGIQEPVLQLRKQLFKVGLSGDPCLHQVQHLHIAFSLRVAHLHGHPPADHLTDPIPFRILEISSFERKCRQMTITLY